MAKKYRIRLKNGRIVGPFALKQVGELFLKGHIEGQESAQVFPGGDWLEISKFPDIKKEIASKLNSSAKNNDGDSTVVRLNIAKEREKLKKKAASEKEKKKKENLKKLEEDNKKSEHQEFKFTREEPKDLIDYEELEKKYQETSSPEIKKESPGKVAEPEGIEKTVILKRPKINENIDKTQVNPEALKLLREQQQREKEAEEEKRRAEEERLKKEEEAQKEEIDFDESTQMIDRSMLSKIKDEASQLEHEMITVEEDDKEKVKEKTEFIEFEEEEEPPKKKMKPIVAFAFIVLLWFLLDDDKKGNPYEPRYVKVIAPITKDVENPAKAKEFLEKGLRSYESGTYLGKHNALDYFRLSIQQKFRDNPALGYLILTYGELFQNVSNRSKGAETIFNLIKITRSKVYKNKNIAMGTALFYRNNDKVNSAINLLENFLRVGDPTLKLLSLYLDFAIDVGDLVKAKKILDKIKQYPNLPLEAYLAMSRYYTLEESYEEGRDIVLKGLQTFPSSVALLLAYGEYQLRSEELSEFSQTLKKIEALKFESSPSYYARYLEYLGILSAYNKDTKTAAILFKTALKINDTDSLRSKLASLDVGGGKMAESLILESKAIDLIRKSLKLRKEKKWELAFKAAIEAVDLPINFLPANLNLVNLQIQRGFYESAIDTLKFLKKDHPIHPGVNFTLVKALFEANKIDEAQLEVGYISNSILRNHPLFESVVGNFYAKAGESTLAVKFLTESVRRNPLRDQDYFAMAKIYNKSRQYKEAKSKLADAITLDPLNIEYKSLYGNILFDLEGAETAIGYLQSELQVNKDNPRLMGDMATYFYRNGQIAQFKEVKNNMENLRSEDPAFYDFMIRAAEIEDNKEEMIKFSKKLIEVNPGDVEARMELGVTLASVGKYQDALRQFKEVTKRLSDYPKVFYNIAKVYIKLKDYKSAIAAAKQEEENNPNIYNGYYILGETYRLAGKYTEAVGKLEKAISLNPRNVESLMSLGWIKLSQRDYDIARELYLRAKRQAPSNPEIRKQLGFIYQGIGQSGLAIEEFSTYLKLFPNAPDRAQVQNQIRILSR